mgnify:CR=1 FL=1
MSILFKLDILIVQKNLVSCLNLTISMVGDSIYESRKSIKNNWLFSGSINILDKVKSKVEKMSGNKINIAFVEELGNGFITSISIEKMKEYL